mmetsp:Transcript_36193/g.71696  ORF Transcript_36193/g.71696 Transcript_36193/m.71696 type:complete len:299 (-) Transcript_36193:298-1194(-)
MAKRMNRTWSTGMMNMGSNRLSASPMRVSHMYVVPTHTPSKAYVNGWPNWFSPSTTVKDRHIIKHLACTTDWVPNRALKAAYVTGITVALNGHGVRPGRVRRFVNAFSVYRSTTAAPPAITRKAWYAWLLTYSSNSSWDVRVCESCGPESTTVATPPTIMATPNTTLGVTGTFRMALANTTLDTNCTPSSEASSDCAAKPNATNVNSDPDTNSTVPNTKVDGLCIPFAFLIAATVSSFLRGGSSVQCSPTGPSIDTSLGLNDTYEDSLSMKSSFCGSDSCCVFSEDASSDVCPWSPRL